MPKPIAEKERMKSCDINLLRSNATEADWAEVASVDPTDSRNGADPEPAPADIR